MTELHHTACSGHRWSEREKICSHALSGIFVEGTIMHTRRNPTVQGMVLEERLFEKGVFGFFRRCGHNMAATTTTTTEKIIGQDSMGSSSHAQRKPLHTPQTSL
jgi:hypothetical protein